MVSVVANITREDVTAHLVAENAAFLRQNLKLPATGQEGARSPAIQYFLVDQAGLLLEATGSSEPANVVSPNFCAKLSYPRDTRTSPPEIELFVPGEAAVGALNVLSASLKQSVPTHSKIAVFQAAVHDPIYDLNVAILRTHIAEAQDAVMGALSAEQYFWAHASGEIIQPKPGGIEPEDTDFTFTVRREKGADSTHPESWTLKFPPAADEPMRERILRAARACAPEGSNVVATDFVARSVSDPSSWRLDTENLAEDFKTAELDLSVAGHVLQITHGTEVRRFGIRSSEAHNQAVREANPHARGSALEVGEGVSFVLYDLEAPLARWKAIRGKSIDLNGDEPTVENLALPYDLPCVATLKLRGSKLQVTIYEEDSITVQPARPSEQVAQ